MSNEFPEARESSAVRSEQISINDRQEAIFQQLAASKLEIEEVSTHLATMRAEVERLDDTVQRLLHSTSEDAVAQSLPALRMLHLTKAIQAAQAELLLLQDDIVGLESQWPKPEKMN